MDTVVERPGALDAHKASVTAAVRLPGRGRRREQHVAQFRTTVQGLLALGAGGALTLAGAPYPSGAARALIALMEGILLDALRTGNAVLSASELKATVRAILGRSME